MRIALDQNDGPLAIVEERSDGELRAISKKDPAVGGSLYSTSLGFTVPDIAPSLSIAATDATKDEGDSGTTNFTFTVTRSGDLDRVTSVDYAVTGSGGNPANATDFDGTLPSGSLVFSEGDASKAITIGVSGDTTAENDEGFTVTLSGAFNGIISSATATGTITDDDTPALDLTFADGTDTLDARVTFTGTTNRTRVNSSGNIVSVTSGNPRFDYDPVTLAAKGLLIEKEARTNHEDYSVPNATGWSVVRSVLTVNNATAPDGATTATLVTDDGVSTAGVVGCHTGQFATTPTSSTITFSVFAKAGSCDRLQFNIRLWTTPANTAVEFNLTSGTLQTEGTGTTSSIEDYGNGWFRCITTFDNDAVDPGGEVRLYMGDASGFNLTCDGTNTIYLWGQQCEVGSNASSYIPTSGATATRAAETAVMTGTNFSGWFAGASSGSFVWDGIAYLDGERVLSANDGTANEVIAIDWADAAQGIVTDGGAAQASLDGGTLTDGTASKIALAFAASDFALSLDGGAVVSDASGTIPAPSQLEFGSGHHANVQFFAKRVADTRLLELTT